MLPLKGAVVLHVVITAPHIMADMRLAAALVIHFYHFLVNNSYQ